MPDLAALTVEFFAERVGTTFQVDSAAAPVALRVTDATAWGEPPGGGRRRAFTVHFLGPAEPVLQQQIHRLESGDSDPLELFLVPLGPTGNGIEYEAVFS